MLPVAENMQLRFDIVWCDREVSIYLRHLLHLCMLKRETVPKKNCYVSTEVHAQYARMQDANRYSAKN